MAKEVKAVVGCDPKNPNSVIQRANSVTTGLNGNQNFPNPNPTVASLNTMRTDAVQKQTAWGSRNDHGSSTDKINFESSISTLYKALIQECNLVNNVAPNNETVLPTSGFPLSNQPVNGVLMDPPQNLRRLISKSLGLHQVKNRWKKPGNATKGKRINYLLYRSMNPAFASASVIKNVTKCTYTDEPPIPAGASSATYYYWVVALTAAGESQPSDVCQCVVAVAN